MKLNKHNLSFFLCFTVIFLVGIGLTYVYATSNSTFTISSGIYPSAFSYTIYKEGTTYYVKNAYGNLMYSGTDISQLTQNIINLNESDCSIFFTDGEYRFSSTISITNTNDNFTLLGVGVSTRLIMITNNTFISAIGTSGNPIIGLTIKDLYIEGYPSTWAGWTCNTKSNIYFEYVSWSNIESVVMRFGSGNGIYLYYCSCMQLNNLLLYDGSGFGMWISSVSDSIISGCHVYGFRLSGILLMASGTISISGCSFDTNLQFGLDLYDSTWNAITGCLFFDNNFAGTEGTYSNVRLANTQSKFNTIVGNMFRGEDVLYHIHLGTGTSNNTIIGNNVASPTYSGTKIVDSGTNNTIAHNTGY